MMNKNRERVCNSNKDCCIVDINKDDKLIIFYPVVFNSVDSWGRAYDPKSFNRTIKNNGYRFPFLQEHNTSRVAGYTSEMVVDDKGVLTTVKVLNTDAGIDVWELTVNKVLTRYSFAGWVVKSEDRVVNGNTIQYVTEVALDEVTTTLFPANPDAKLIDIENAIRRGTLTKEQLNVLTPDESHSNSHPKEDTSSYADVIKMIKEY